MTTTNSTTTTAPEFYRYYALEAIDNLISHEWNRGAAAALAAARPTFERLGLTPAATVPEAIAALAAYATTGAAR